METRYTKIHTAGTNAALKITPGHFATNHSHINYYLDMTTLKTRASEAQDVAKGMVGAYLYGMVVDTIVCMEGTEVIGAFLSEELTRSGVLSKNMHKTIYIVRPEFNNNSQIIFRDNTIPMIKGKNVIILVAMVTTGFSAIKAIESVQYYGGNMQGVSAVFSAVDQVGGVPVHSVFGKKDVPNYVNYDYRECPMCRQGQKLDALVNAFGYSKM
ncbi:MAG: orotate phosphoribosyltransferase [Lachnospiraceae bacterium]|nr:orotate phosphoribosyltransferase [Lachnospiraceae bacterium]MCI9183592.1 orotate phosphoribosyltransferase [Lachnospiraceae bacterium]